MNKEHLAREFEIAKETDSDLAIELTVPDSDVTEVIIVKNGNLDYKLNYYNENYNDDLELIRFPEIRITKITVINWDLRLLA